MTVFSDDLQRELVQAVAADVLDDGMFLGDAFALFLVPVAALRQSAELALQYGEAFRMLVQDVRIGDISMCVAPPLSWLAIAARDMSPRSMPHHSWMGSGHESGSFLITLNDTMYSPDRSNEMVRPEGPDGRSRLQRKRSSPVTPGNRRYP